MSNNYRYNIAAFGELLIDFTYEGISNAGQKMFAQNPGGAPANVLVAASRLGASSAFLGKVGNDMHGSFLRKILRSENVDTKGLILDDKYFTTLAFVDLNENGERSFSFARKPGADTKMECEEVNLDILKNANIYHVGSLSLTNEPSRSTTIYSVKKAKEYGCIISYDPNYRDSLWQNEECAKKHIRSLIEYVDVMKISDEEMELVTDKNNPVEAAKFLINNGVKLVVITLGKDGAYVCNNEVGKFVSGFRSNSIDTTGAGDSFWGGFLYKLSESNEKIQKITLKEAEKFVRFSNAVASICVEGKGAIPSMPKMEEVLDRLKTNKK